VSAALRFLIALLHQPWAARTAAIISALLVASGILGVFLHWPSYLSFFIWGLIWAIVAVAAWVMNR
jgi:Isoprenylcysteine carboxyl methyltransferase (ICMT) family